MTIEIETAERVQAHYWAAFADFNEAAARNDEVLLEQAADALEAATHDVFVTRAPTPALLAGKVKIAMQDVENRAAKEWLETIKVDLDHMSQTH